MLVRCLFLALVAAAAAGCGGSEGSSGSDNPTLVAVSPEAFLGDVPCLAGPGSMRRYVATLEDVTGGLGSESTTIDSFPLPSSPPVSCNLPVGFGFVVDEHRYAADVDGYDTTALEPLAPGSRFMVSTETGEFVTPRWTTSCGRQDEGTHTSVIAQTRQTIYVRGCAELVDQEPGATATGVRVRLGSALGDLECGDDPGNVERFVVSLRGGDASPTEADCGATATFEGLDAPATYVVDVEAYESGSDAPGWATTCYAITQPGALVEATCEPLTDSGSLEVDVPALLSQAGQTCGADGVARVVVSLPTDSGPRTHEQENPECEESVRFEGLRAGYYELTVRTELADGSEGPAARCEAQVRPVSLSVADCDLL